MGHGFLEQVILMNNTPNDQISPANVGKYLQFDFVTVVPLISIDSY